MSFGYTFRILLLTVGIRYLVHTITAHKLKTMRERQQRKIEKCVAFLGPQTPLPCPIHAGLCLKPLCGTHMWPETQTPKLKIPLQ